MADKKVEKALYGPSTFEVALGALLGLAAGVAVACVYLVFKPVLPVSEAPKEPARGMVYYIAGGTDAGKGRDWKGEVATFVSGGAVSANEDELNLWAASLAAPPVAAAPSGGNAAAAAPAPVGSSNDFVSARGLNFRLADGQMQIAQRVLLNYFGLSKEVLMQARGDFVRVGDGFVFRPREFFLGSCPLHVVPGATGAFGKVLLAKQPLPEDFRAAWSKVAEIAVDGRLLKVTTQP